MDFKLVEQALKKNLYNYCLFFIGLEIILCYIYLRLFIPRYCYTLEYLRLHHTFLHLMLYIDFIILHTTILLLILYKEYKNYYQIAQNFSFQDKVRNIINIIYWNPLLYLHDLIAPEIPYSGMLMLKYSNFIAYFYKKTKKLYLINCITILFIFIPRILLVIIFIIEICFFNRINYFIYFLPILLLPQIYKIFLKLCESFCERSFLIIKEDLIIISQGDCPKCLRLNFSLQDTVYKTFSKDTDFDKYLHDLVSDWFEFYTLNLITVKSKSLINTYESYISFFCSSLYLIAGIYKLWFVFF